MKKQMEPIQEYTPPVKNYEKQKKCFLLTFLVASAIVLMRTIVKKKRSRTQKMIDDTPDVEELNNRVT